MIENLKQMIQNFSPTILYSSKEEEFRRLEELNELNIVDTPPEEEFDLITNLVSSIFQMPVSLISFLTEEKQFFKSCIGLNVNETDREIAFCQHVIANKQSMVVEDALLDDRFKDNPLVHEYNIRFYAGAPLITKKGNFIGTLCLIDVKPRAFSDREMKQLETFADIIISKIENRQQLQLHNELQSKLLELNNNYSLIVNNVNDTVFQTDSNGNWGFLSPSWENIMGYPVKDTLGKSFFHHIHPKELEDNKKQFLPLIKGIKKDCKYVSRFLDHEGKSKWIRVYASHIVSDNNEIIGTIGTLSDITDLVELEHEKQQDLALARKVQLSVVSTPIHDDTIAIDCEYLASNELSGDMYYWEKIDKSKYGVMILDVMGHGIASSLITMSIRSLLRPLINEVQDPKKLYETLNNHMLFLFDSTTGVSSYFTAIYLVIDTEKQVITYINAGHPAGIMLTNNQKVDKLVRGALPIGIVDNHPLEIGTLTYEKNTSILLYTDGLSEVLSNVSVDDFLINCLYEYKQTSDNLANYVKNKCQLPEKLPDDLCIISIELK